MPRCGRLRHVSEVGIRPGETADYHTEFTLDALQSERTAERQEATTTGHRADDASYVVSPEGVVFPVDLGIVQDAVHAAYGAASPAPEGRSTTTNASSPAEARGVASERGESRGREDKEVKPAPATSECATEPPQAADDRQEEPHPAAVAQRLEDSQSALRERMTRLEARMESLDEKLAAIVECLGEFQKSRRAAAESTGGERHEEGASEQSDATSANAGVGEDSASDGRCEAGASNRGDVTSASVGEDSAASESEPLAEEPSCDVEDTNPPVIADEAADGERVEVAADADLAELEVFTPDEGRDDLSEVAVGGDGGAGSETGEGAPDGMDADDAVNADVVAEGDTQVEAEGAGLCPNTLAQAGARLEEQATVTDAEPVETDARRAVLGPRGEPAGMVFANSVGGELGRSNEPSARERALVQRIGATEQRVDTIYEVVVHGR